MIGVYRFFSGGNLVAESRNLITTEGRRAILRYLASQTGLLAQSLAVGIGSQAATVNDVNLNFEVERTLVDFVSPDFIGNKIIFKGTLPVGSHQIIHEAGLWTLQNNTNAGNYGSKLLLGFDSITESWSGGTFVTDDNRLGTDYLRLNPAANGTLTSSSQDLSFDLLGYGDTEALKLAYIVQDANCSSFKLRLKNDNSNYFEFTVTNPSAGYQVASFLKSNATVTGSPSWSTISVIEVSVSAKVGGGTQVDFDALRIDDNDTYNPDYVLLSRSVLGSPIVKTAVKSLDIEYTLDVV